MAEVGKVASAPMNRFDSNLSDQQRTKTAAFEMLKTYGQDGHLLTQQVPSYQRCALVALFQRRLGGRGGGIVGLFWHVKAHPSLGMEGGSRVTEAGDKEADKLTNL